MRLLYISLFLAIFFSACKKSELEQIPSNEPPPDKTISSVTVENYITRTYILALGREPDPTEFNQAYTTLTAAKVDSISRRNFLNQVFSSNDFRAHVYEENKINLLNNTDTADFTNWITLFNYLLSDSTYVLQWTFLQYEVDRLIPLRNAYSEYVNGSIEVDELQRRMCNNYEYDQINMGSANFVISTFQNLINRNPTSAEQQSGISIVDGNNAVIFLQAGSSKNDYLNILTHSSNYFEGQVVFLYQKYLNRLPNTLEMAGGTSKYQSTGDFTAVQYDILASDEFIGL
jgi:hypothetical protein